MAKIRGRPYKGNSEMCQALGRIQNYDPLYSLRPPLELLPGVDWISSFPNLLFFCQFYNPFIPDPGGVPIVESYSS